MALPASPPWLAAILDKESFLQWHAFFNKFFHNHKAQALVAVARLGADEDRIKARCEWENNHLVEGKHKILSFAEQPDLVLPVEVDSLKSDNIQDYLGADVGYYKVLDHYTKLYKEKYAGDIQAFLRSELGPLVDGQLGSLYHGVIQTAYGYAGKSDQVVIEGVALCFHEFTQIKSNTDPNKARDISRFGTGTADFKDVLAKVKAARAQKYDSDPGAWRLSTTIAKNFGHEFLDFTDEIKLPVKLDHGKEDMAAVRTLMDWVLDMAAVVYLESDHVNDFFFLHGVTGAWSLMQTLDFLDYKTAMIAIRAHLTTMLIISGRQNPAGLSKRPEDYWKGDSVTEESWTESIKHLRDDNLEAHVHKLGQCMYEAWKKNPTGPYAKHYIAATRMVLTTDGFHF